MQTISSALTAALLTIDARVDPRRLIDLFEFYASDYVPGVNGFDPDDAEERFASETITWNGNAYRREIQKGSGRGDIVRSMGEKTNSVTVTFSNISRYLATWAQTTPIEGKFLVIRTIVPSVTDDSLVLFVGRCDKPSDIDKKSFSLSARQDFGNINQSLPPDKFTPDDPEGRLPGDDLYEGIPFVAVPGTYAYPFVRVTNGLGGRILGRRTTDRRTEQFSSIAETPYGSVIPEIFGRCQMELIPFISVDKGIFLSALWAVSKGPIAAVENIKTQQAGLSDPINSFETPPDPAVVHLGDLGGTGTNQGNTGQADLGGGSKFSHLAYVEGAIVPTEYFQNPSLSDPNVLNELPTVTALVLGRIVDLPDGTGAYVLEGFTTNPVHIARFILTHPSFVNINPAFMEDAVNYLTGLHCDEPLMDESQMIVINEVDIPQAGTSFTRYRSSGLITPGSLLDREGFEIADGPYIGFDPIDPIDPLFCPIGQHRDPETGLCVADLPGTVWNSTQPMLRPRYTVNFPITGEVRAVDLLYKTVLPAFKGFMRVNKYGRYEIHSEKPSDATKLRSATAVGATSIPILDATPWKSGALLTGRLLLGVGLETAEVRTIASADYSTSGNSISLSASSTGSVTATASGANLSGGSTTVQASGTITIGGTPSGSITATIDGVAIGYILGTDDTTDTAAQMLAAYINATQRISKYITAEVTGSVITIKCKHGALNVSAPFLKAHTGPITDPTTAPTVAASAGSLQAGTYQLAYANVNANGLTALTLLATITLTASQQIDVSGLPAFPAGVTSRQFFVSEKANSTFLRYQATRTDAADFSINALPLPGAALPPSFNTTAEELIRIAMSFATNSQDVFPMRKSLTAVILNDIYLPDPLNGHKYQATSITTGITASGIPTWPTTVGGTVVDGGVTWTEIGSTVLQQTGLTRANIIKDTYKWPLGGRQSSVNRVKGSFRDAKNDFALTPYRVSDPVHYAQVKKWYDLEFDGSAIDNPHQFFRIANWLLSKNREGDWFNALETGPQGLVLEEGDVICASDDSGGLINVPTRIEEIRIKPNHEVTITQARKYSTTMFSDDVGSHVVPIASTLRHVTTLDSVIEFLDTPALRPEDGLVAGFYVSITRDLSLDGDWRGWALYADYGDGYVKVVENKTPATLGAATTILSDVADITVLDAKTFTADSTTDVITATAHGHLDGQRVTVRNSGGALPGGLTINTVYFVRDVTANTFKLALTSGGAAINLTSNGTGTQTVSTGLAVAFDYVAAANPFTNATEAELIANPRRNLFLVGSELVQAGTIVDNGSRSFTISDLLHGRFETECVDHSIGERVVYIDGAEVFVPTDVSRLNLPYNYKAVTTNQDVADATAVPFTWAGNILQVPPPTEFSAAEDTTSNDVLFDWLGLSFYNGLTTELYDLEISVPGDGDFSTVRSIQRIPPNDWNQYVIWDIEGATLTDTIVTGVAPGGFNISGNGGILMQEARMSAKQTFLIGGGVVFEFEIPTTTRIPASVSIRPVGGDWEDGIYISTNSEGGGIPADPIFVGDGTGASVEVYTSVPGDRFTIVLRPDSQAQVFINRGGPSSVPLFTSTLVLSSTQRYGIEISEIVNTFGEFNLISGLRKAVLSRFTPEWMYTADAQRDDNSGVLPDTINARVKQRSFVDYGPPSRWATTAFNR